MNKEELSKLTLKELIRIWAHRVLEGGGVGHIYEDELELLYIHTGLEPKE